MLIYFFCMLVLCLGCRRALCIFLCLSIYIYSCMPWRPCCFFSEHDLPRQYLTESIIPAIAILLILPCHLYFCVFLIAVPISICVCLHLFLHQSSSIPIPITVVNILILLVDVCWFGSLLAISRLGKVRDGRSRELCLCLL